MSNKFTLFGFIKRAAETPSVSAENPITWDDVKNVSADDVKKYFHLTGARNPKSDMDRWKTVAAMRGIKNLSNKSFAKWRNSANRLIAPKDQSGVFNITPEELMAVTKPRMDAHSKMTGAQDLNSEVDRWKTIAAEKGNRNLSNKDFARWKKNNKSMFSVVPSKYDAKAPNTKSRIISEDPIDALGLDVSSGNLTDPLNDLVSKATQQLDPWYDKSPQAGSPSPSIVEPEKKSLTAAEARFWRSDDPISYYSRSEMRRKIEDITDEYEGAMLHPREYSSEKQKYDLQQKIIELYNGIVNQGMTDRPTLDAFDALMAKYDKYLSVKDRVIFESLAEGDRALRSGKRSIFD